ncbi:hypothetical protein CABS01_01783 [Colletotrichum abscissum]|uniref:uncharacterized protein n=1 Tax=Colletotrichum abscissum TaxID=1671311 RepID=UPI0027D566A7|nr:uncharacterized protein CABS01_01783 [Colletotrichum abscissum]KAK1495976.1 hypothetical protein CABS01_01783 [Colletotrichum abscissum]
MYPYVYKKKGTQRLQTSVIPSQQGCWRCLSLRVSESLSLCLPLPTSPHDTPQRDRSRPRTLPKSRRGPSRTAALPVRLAPALL